VVLTITEMLRRHGVVGKFVEFYGEGVGAVPLANRATIGNMSPEFGSTAAIFPIDEETVRYLKLTGRSPEQIALVEAYAKEQGLWHDPAREPVYSETLELDLGTVVPSIAGPKRPQDRIALTDAKPAFRQAIRDYTDDPDSDGVDEAGKESFPASDSPAPGSGGDEAAPVVFSAAEGGNGRPSKPVPVSSDRPRRVRARPRRGRDRLDHELHQHVQPLGDGRRRAAWPRTPLRRASRSSRG
jgi:aconitate hydratase